MTRAEYRAVMRHPGSFGRRLVWTVDPERDDWLRLTAGPCPFLDGKNTCAVYDARPMNCRRFACFRPEPAREPLELTAGPLGCVNLFDRFKASRAVRRAYRALEVKAQAWGRAHGWMGTP